MLQVKLNCPPETPVVSYINGIFTLKTEEEIRSLCILVIVFKFVAEYSSFTKEVVVLLD